MSKYKEFRDLQSNLSESDINELVNLIGYRCRESTKRRIRSILTYGSGTIPDFGIMRRLVKTDNVWEYIPGQSYDDEIRIVRNIIITGKA